MSAGTEVAATVRWTDGTDVHTYRLGAGRTREVTVTMPADFAVVMTVTSDHQGKVSCTMKVDGEATHGTKSQESDQGTGVSVITCGEASPRPRGNASSTGAHKLTFHARAARLTAYLLTPNVWSSFSAGDALLTDQLDGGDVLAIVASNEGAATCDIDVDGKAVSTKSVKATGEIAVCRTTIT